MIATTFSFYKALSSYELMASFHDSEMVLHFLLKTLFLLSISFFFHFLGWEQFGLWNRRIILCNGGHKRYHLYIMVLVYHILFFFSYGKPACILNTRVS